MSKTTDNVAVDIEAVVNVTVTFGGTMDRVGMLVLNVGANDGTEVVGMTVGLCVLGSAVGSTDGLLEIVGCMVGFSRWTTLV